MRGVYMSPYSFIVALCECKPDEGKGTQVGSLSESLEESFIPPHLSYGPVGKFVADDNG